MQPQRPSFTNVGLVGDVSISYGGVSLNPGQNVIGSEVITLIPVVDGSLHFSAVSNGADEPPEPDVVVKE